MTEDTTGCSSVSGCVDCILRYKVAASKGADIVSQDDCMTPHARNLTRMRIPWTAGRRSRDWILCSFTVSCETDPNDNFDELREAAVVFVIGSSIRVWNDAASEDSFDVVAYETFVEQFAFIAQCHDVFFGNTLYADVRSGMFGLTEAEHSRTCVADPLLTQAQRRDSF
eukprot:gene20911-biopygen7022